MKRKKNESRKSLQEKKKNRDFLGRNTRRERRSE